MDKEYLSVNQISKQYQVPRSAVRKWIEMGLRHEVLPNGYYKINKSDLKSFLKSRQIVSPWKILLVDDNLEFLRITSEILENEGYQTIISDNMVDAVLKARRIIPDLFIIDVVFPEDGDGVQLARKLREVENLDEIPIIFVSGKMDGKKVLDKCMDLGGAGFIEKPFDPERLIEEVKQALRHFAVRNNV